MRYLRPPASVPLVLISLLLGACGGGGGSPADISPASPPQPVITESTPNRFLTFPNPQVQADGSFQTTSTAWAQAYYAAVDPNNQKDTLDKWKAANGFGSGTGTEVNVVFGDVRDWGYGRNLTFRQNLNGTVAANVENYFQEAAGGYTYSRVHLEAAVIKDPLSHKGTNAIEVTPGPNGGPNFAKFYTFDPGTGARRLTIDMDGRGEKAMPGPCISCHGGRGDALTPPDANGKRLFNLVQNSVSKTRGDVQARLHVVEPDVLDYSTAAGFTRADQEAKIKVINRMVLCTYPIATASTFPEDACRPAANQNEWQGAAAAQIKNAYGGDGLPKAVFEDTYVPNSWLVAGQSTLYKEVVATSCRACHNLRGTGNQSDLDFEAFEKFQGYADRIKAHIVDRGNMPLAKLVSEAFYASNRPEILANFLQGQGFTVRDSSGAVLKPGRPISDPGPDRVVRPGPSTLSATGSLFANTYAWTLISGPSGATLTNQNTAQATFTATADGTYVVQLVASNGPTQGAPARLTIVVNSALPIAPAAIRFADIKSVLQSTSAGCTNSGCHAPGGTAVVPPVFYTNTDRNGDGIIGDATDDLWLYTEVRSRINFTDIIASPLLRKPSGNHHNGLLRPGFNTSVAPGQPGREGYDLFANWILNGAPQ
ncbi:MAG: hypothetical protein ABL931_07680 [Usitatibacteraceae bacterium]